MLTFGPHWSCWELMQWGSTKLLRQAGEKQVYWPGPDSARGAADEQGRGKQPIQEKIQEGLVPPRYTGWAVDGGTLHHMG